MSGPFTNIQIDRRTVGAVNTGSIESVDIAVSTIRGAGDEHLAAAIAELTAAVASSSELVAEKQTDVLRILDSLSSEAARPREERPAGVMRSLFASLGEAVKRTPGLMTIWKKVGPVLGAAF